MRNTLNSVDRMNLKASDVHASIAYPLDDTSSGPLFQNTHNVDYTVASQDDKIIHRRGDGDFAVASQSLFPEYSRVIVQDDTVTYVYRGGDIEMKPSRCLSDAEREKIEHVY